MKPAIAGRLSVVARSLAAILFSAVASQSGGAGGPETGEQDPHYNDAGFFDIHVCNWPDRPWFLMPLFSTEHFSEIQQIDVMNPAGEMITRLDLGRYRTIKRKDKPEKRVFIKQTDVPAGAGDGWYSARIRFSNGKEFTARDYVILSRMAQASGQVPGHETEVAAVPEQLKWDPVPGAGYYQVFIRDLWDDGKLLYTSGLLSRPSLTLPAGLLEKGGYYSWVIHARDLNEHILLGDFNHGSMNSPVTFSISP